MTVLNTIAALAACSALAFSGFVLEDRYTNQTEHNAFKHSVQQVFLAQDLRRLDIEIARMRAKAVLTTDEMKYLQYLINERNRLVRG